MQNVFLTSLTVPELRQLFRDELNEYLNSVNNINDQLQQEKKLLNVSEAALYLDKAEQTIYGLVYRKTIPCHKRGNKLYFYKDELDEWIRSGRKRTLSEIEDKATIKPLKGVR